MPEKSDDLVGQPAPSVPLWVRGMAAALGAAAFVAGGVAVFVTDNGTGSGALVAAGVALGALALFGDRISSFGVAGAQVNLVQASQELQAAADRAAAGVTLIAPTVFVSKPTSYSGWLGPPLTATNSFASNPRAGRARPE